MALGCAFEDVASVEPEFPLEPSQEQEQPTKATEAIAPTHNIEIIL